MKIKNLTNKSELIYCHNRGDNYYYDLLKIYYAHEMRSIFAVIVNGSGSGYTEENSTEEELYFSVELDDLYSLLYDGLQLGDSVLEVIKSTMTPLSYITGNSGIGLPDYLLEQECHLLKIKDAIYQLQSRDFFIRKWYPTRESGSGKTVYESNSGGHKLQQIVTIKNDRDYESWLNRVRGYSENIIKISDYINNDVNLRYDIKLENFMLDMSVDPDSVDGDHLLLYLTVYLNINLLINNKKNKLKAEIEKYQRLLDNPIFQEKTLGVRSK